MHNLLTTSVHNLMTLTVHEVLTLYIPRTRYCKGFSFIVDAGDTTIRWCRVNIYLKGAGPCDQL